MFNIEKRKKQKNKKQKKTMELFRSTEKKNDETKN